MHWPPQAQRGPLGASDQDTYTHTHTSALWSASPHYKYGGEPVADGLEPEWICPDSSFSELNCVGRKTDEEAEVILPLWTETGQVFYAILLAIYPSFLLSVIQSVSSYALVTYCNSSGLPPLSKTKFCSSMLIHNRDDNVLCNISLCPFRHQRAREWGLFALLTYMPEGRWVFFCRCAKH